MDDILEVHRAFREALKAIEAKQAQQQLGELFMGGQLNLGGYNDKQRQTSNCSDY